MKSYRCRGARFWALSSSICNRVAGSALKSRSPEPPMPRGAGPIARRSESRPVPKGASPGTRMRRIWLKFHLVLALSFGFLFALMGLSGSILSFHKEIDAWLHPERLLRRNAGPNAPLAGIITRVRDRLPENQAGWTLLFPERSDGVYIAQVSLPGAGEWTDVYEIHVDPGTAEILGERLWGNDLVSFIYHLHFSLLLHENGQTLVGFLGILLLMSLFSGVYLWWPRPGRWRKALVLKRSAGFRRFNYDLHKTLGAVSGIVLLSSAGSGVYLVFPEILEPAIDTLAPVHHPDQTHTTLRSRDPITVDADRALAIARAAYPEHRILALAVPQPGSEAYWLNLSPEDPAASSGSLSEIWIDPRQGRVLQTWDQRNFGAGNHITAWMLPLHNGKAFGLTGRILILCAGLMPLILLITGLTHWLGKPRR